MIKNRAELLAFKEVEVRPDTMPAGVTLSKFFDLHDRNDATARDVFGVTTTNSAATPNG